MGSTRHYTVLFMIVRRISSVPHNRRTVARLHYRAQWSRHHSVRYSHDCTARIVGAVEPPRYDSISFLRSDTRDPRIPVPAHGDHHDHSPVPTSAARTRVASSASHMQVPHTKRLDRAIYCVATALALRTLVPNPHAVEFQVHSSRRLSLKI